MFNQDLINSAYAIPFIAMELQSRGLKKSILVELTGMTDTKLKRHAQSAKVSRSKSPRAGDYGIRWFFQDKERLVHSCNVIRLHQEYRKEYNRAVTLLHTTISYCEMVSSPVLDINQIAFLIKYFSSNAITLEICTSCHSYYIRQTEEFTKCCAHCFAD